MSHTNSFSTTRARKKCGDFAETTAFERYGVKTSEKSNMHNEHWLTLTAFFPFGAPWTNCSAYCVPEELVCVGVGTTRCKYIIATKRETT